MSSVQASAPHPHTGYKSFELGGFSFSRDEYFVTISWPAREAKLSHTLPVDAFLKALMRDVAWGFFYGWVNFDADASSIGQFIDVVVTEALPNSLRGRLANNQAAA